MMVVLIKHILKHNSNLFSYSKYLINSYSTAVKASNKFLEKTPHYMSLNNEWTTEHVEIANNLFKDMIVHENFISEIDENNLMNELEPYMKRLRYEFDHWDDAIHGFRETERLQWNTENMKTLDRLRDLAFPKSVAQLKHVHILDLAAKGYIKPHIDAIRFCGNTIAGISLLSDSVMRLVHDKFKNLSTDIHLKRRSLYVMKDTARYDYTHEILKDEISIFKGVKVPRARRISVICRNEPK